MPITPTYGLAATAVPAIQVPGAFLNPSDGTPLLAESLTAGATTGLVTAFNRNAERLDANARYGGGAYAVAAGLGLSEGSGLTLNIAEGVAVIDGTVHVAATTLALTDAVENYVWLTQGGTLAKKTSADASPLLPPTGGLVYLGRVTCAAGVITAIDYSGRPELRGGTLFRRTGDADVPGDTPPATLVMVQQTAGGRWVWDGGAYSHIGQIGMVQDTIAASSSVTIPAGYQEQVFESLTIGGVLTVAGKLRVTS